MNSLVVQEHSSTAMQRHDLTAVLEEGGFFGPEMIKEWLAVKYPKSANTRRGYLHDFARFEAWRKENYELYFNKGAVERFMGYLQTERREYARTDKDTFEYDKTSELVERSPATGRTVNRAVSVIKRWADHYKNMVLDQPRPKDPRERQVWMMDRAELIVQMDRIANIGRAKEPEKQKSADVGRRLDPDETARLSKACMADDSISGIRDAALFGVGVYTGARRFEIANLELRDVMPNQKDKDGNDCWIIHFRKTKGGKSRKGRVYNGGIDALIDWLEIRGWSEPGPLFCPINRGGKMTIDKPMSGEALRQILDRRAEQSRVKNVSWHDFRRTFCSDLLAAGVDINVVKDLMGHANINTTAGYDRRGKIARERAVRKLHFPYQRRTLG